jgi:uncharacterized protein (DUF2235 family)
MLRRRSVGNGKMAKNIVILLDGTSNQVSADRTNILRLYGVLEKSDRQLVYYDPGVGTLGDDRSWLWIWRKATEIWSLATGWGLDDNVKEAYRFLVENYDKGRGSDAAVQERDRIYIFGFSRGGYTARVLAGFINALGLIEKRNLNLLDYAYRAYKRIGVAGATGFEEMRLYERVLQADRPPIRCLGLFDTVASVIESGRFVPRLRSHAFTSRNPSVESVRHTVAVDERRTMFNAILWPADGMYRGNPFNRIREVDQDVREVWFNGCHCDVGGGLPEAESALAKVPLRWMIEQTASMGLAYVARNVKTMVMGEGGREHLRKSVRWPGWWCAHSRDNDATLGDPGVPAQAETTAFKPTGDFRHHDSFFRAPKNPGGRPSAFQRRCTDDGRSDKAE